MQFLNFNNTEQLLCLIVLKIMFGKAFETGLDLKFQIQELFLCFSDE